MSNSTTPPTTTPPAQAVLSAMSSPAYLPYLTEAEQLLIVALDATTVVVIGRLLYFYYTSPRPGQADTRRQGLSVRVTSLSPTMLIYLWTLGLFALCALPNWAYIATAWSPAPNSVPIYNPTLLYWTGCSALLQPQASPPVVFFITLERCVAIRLSTAARKLTRVITILDMLVVRSICVATVSVYQSELPLSLGLIANCRFASCTLVKVSAVTG